jgi:glycosyltransferase-like protein
MRPSVALYTYSTLPRGSVVHTAALAEALHDAGWEVTVYALDKDGSGFFRRLRAPLHLVPAAPTPPTTAALVRQRRRELARYVAQHALHHDIHHAQDCLTGNGLLDLRARGHQLSIVRTVHHVERFADPYLAGCQERSIREASLCLAVSEAAAWDVTRGFAVPTLPVGNGVAFDRWRRADPGRVAAWRARLGAGAGPLVLAVGGVEERKNTLRVLGAFALLREQQAGARLCILGGASVLDHGVYRFAFERRLAALPAAAREAVTELGVVADEQVPALFHAASVLALPSLQEGFGLAALEALAAGLPLVAADRPPFTEYLDQGCATLVDPLSEHDIAAGITRALDGSPARREAGRRRARVHSWQRVALLHADHYRKLMGEPRDHARDALRGSLA